MSRSDAATGRRSMTMACKERLIQLLDEHRAWYEVLPHREVFTAQDVAHAAHVSGSMLAKVVVVREGTGTFCMCVLPAPAHLDFGILGRTTGRGGLGLATEAEITRLFPDCDAGAMPPFGTLYRMPLYLDACFRNHTRFYFQPGNHHEVVHMRYADYERVAGKPVGVFCMHGALHGAAR